MFVLWNNFFRYILFTTYHNYHYLVTTEIDLLLIYLCKSKNPSFVIPPKRPEYSGYLHKLLYLILFYNLKSKPIIYAQNINTYHLLNISMGSNSLSSCIWVFIAFALKISFKSAVLGRFEIKNSQKSFSALIIYKLICPVKNEEVRLRWRRDHPYITSSKVLVGWVQ